LTLLSRRTFRGRVRGERRSPRRGHSVEFCDYRAYGVGDDLRYVDWNIYGRLDRLHVKLFVDEEDLCLHLLLDASASMDFGAPHTRASWGSSTWSVSVSACCASASPKGGRPRVGATRW